MLTHVFGKPGSGKTSYVVHKIVTEDLCYINWRYRATLDYIKNYNKSHIRQLTSPPERHVVFANIDIHRTLPSMSSYPINGFEFGAPNNFQKVKRLVPYGVYIFDEAQQYWDSKGESHLPPWVNRIFELRRHIGIDIYCITQKMIRLHSDIRSTVDLFVKIDKSIHTYEINGKKVKSKKFLDTGTLLKTEFFGVEFEDESEVQAYLNGNHAVGKKFKEIHDGDIRKCYNPHEYAVELEDGNTDYNYTDYNQPTTMCNIPESWRNYKKAKAKGV